MDFLQLPGSDNQPGGYRRKRESGQLPTISAYSKLFHFRAPVQIGADEFHTGARHRIYAARWTGDTTAPCRRVVNFCADDSIFGAGLFTVRDVD